MIHRTRVEHDGTNAPDYDLRSMKRATVGAVLAWSAIGIACLCSYIVWALRRAAAEEIAYQLTAGYVFELLVIPLLVVALVLVLESVVRLGRASHRAWLVAGVLLPGVAAIVAPA